MNNPIKNIILCSFVVVGIVGAYITAHLPSPKTQEPAPVFMPEEHDVKFKKAMETIYRHEGGLSNLKHDRGLITKYGISLRYLKLSNNDINKDGKIDDNDIIHLTRTDADKLYYKEWYLSHGYDAIDNQTMLTDILDFSINAGASQCHKTLKRAINEFLSDPIKVNGQLTKDDIELINQIEPSVLHDAFNHQQEMFYRGLVEKRPEYKIFLKGWLLRSKD